VTHLDAAAVLDSANVRVALDMQAVEAILADSTGSRIQQLMAAWSAYQPDPFASDLLVQHEAHIPFTRASGLPRKIRFF
jgi:hypothetical protein